MENLKLASDFEAATEVDWLRLANKALNGADFGSLRTPLFDCFHTEPLYTADSSATTPAVPSTSKSGWTVIQSLGGSSADAKAQFDLELKGGTDGVWLDLSASALKLTTADQVSELFSGDAQKKAAIYLENSGSVAECALLLAGRERLSPPLCGSAGFDPLSAIALTGEMPADRSTIFADSVDAALYLKTGYGTFTPFLASDRVWNGAGGSAVHDLAFTLAAGVSYWRALFEAGEDMRSAASMVSFSLTATADIFLTIAKFRAIRLLWHRALAAAVETPDTSQTQVIAQSSVRMLSVYDPHTNLLRGTAAAFAASIGGANGIRVHPYTYAAQQTTALSRRMARNTSHILSHEARLGAVADAAHGSWYVENLTQTLAEKSWALFREVEAQGGLGAALAEGFVQRNLRSARERRENNIAHQRDKLTGVSVFPDTNESYADLPQYGAKEAAPPLLNTLDLPPTGTGARFAALVKAAHQGATLPELQAACIRVRETVAEPLIMPRDAEPFEKLRQRSDIALKMLGSRPPIFMGLLGTLEDYRSRSLWVQGFFMAGGIETLMPSQGFATVDALVVAFKKSPAPVACLCSSDAGYASMSGAAIALKRAGAAFVYLAAPASALGKLDPADARAVDRLIFEGCNAVSILQEAQAVLRVEELSASTEGEE